MDIYVLTHSLSLPNRPKLRQTCVHCIHPSGPEFGSIVTTFSGGFQTIIMKDTPSTRGLAASSREKKKSFFSTAIRSKECFSRCALFLGRQLSAKLLMNRLTELSAYSGQLL